MEHHNPCRSWFFSYGNFAYVQHLSPGCSQNYHHQMESYAYVSRVSSFWIFSFLFLSCVFSLIFCRLSHFFAFHFLLLPDLVFLQILHHLFLHLLIHHLLCRALHVQSLSCLVKNGAGLEGRSGGRRRRWRRQRGAGRTPAPPAGNPVPGRRRQVTKW